MRTKTSQEQKKDAISQKNISTKNKNKDNVTNNREIRDINKQWIKVKGHEHIKEHKDMLNTSNTSNRYQLLQEMEDQSESSIENKSIEEVMQVEKDERKAKDMRMPLKIEEHIINSITIETLERMLCDTHEACSYLRKVYKEKDYELKCSAKLYFGANMLPLQKRTENKN